MTHHFPRDAFELLTQRLSAIDAEIRSIRATLFQLSDNQQRVMGRGEMTPVRTAEDFVHQPD
jgi:hypothetical protein